VAAREKRGIISASGNFDGVTPRPPREPIDQHATGTQLLAAGMTTATVDLDAGARWSEASRLAVLSPFSAKLANVGSIEVNATLGNVPPPRSARRGHVMAATAAVEAGRSRSSSVISAAST